jgi:hypothetical protein
MPGPNPGNEAFAHRFTAGTLAYLGDGQSAERHARAALSAETATGPGHYLQISGNYIWLCHAYLRRREPEPEQAADAAGRALGILDGSPTRTVIQQAGQVWQDLDARWPGLPAVRDLGELVSTSRQALPAAPA